MPKREQFGIENKVVLDILKYVDPDIPVAYINSSELFPQEDRVFHRVKLNIADVTTGGGILLVFKSNIKAEIIDTFVNKHFPEIDVLVIFGEFLFYRVFHVMVIYISSSVSFDHFEA